MAEQKAEAERQRTEMLAREETRQNNIARGRTAISDAFAGFDDNFFNTARQDYAANLLPQVEKQRLDAVDKTRGNLADRGMLRSTVGNAQIAKIEERAGEARTNIGNEAQTFSNTIKGQVEQQKNNLFDINLNAADPSTMAARAQGEAATLAQMPGGNMPTSVGSVFTDLITPFAYSFAANQGSRNPTRFGNFFAQPQSNSVTYG